MGIQQLTAGDDLAGKQVLEALSLLIINESKATLRRMVAEGKIQINGRNVPLSALIDAGDTFTVPGDLDLGAPPAGKIALDIIMEDVSHLAINKPPGIPVLPDRNGKQREFYDSVKAYVNRESDPSGPYVRPHIVHRLDRETSGVMLVGKNTAAARPFPAVSESPGN